ncbi:MAG: AbrB/MazE/SpoVT family DNA-binding domain-containing protein [Chloroflexota bacterium]
MRQRVKVQRRKGMTRISAKNQVTLPIDALSHAGLSSGDRLRAQVHGPGQILLVREADPIEEFGGALTDVYPANYLEELRREWA